MNYAGTIDLGASGTPDGAFAKINAQRFHAAMLAAGLLQTADTGQLDIANITTTTGGYLIYQFDDPEQAQFPVIVKFALGFTGPGIYVTITVGTGTDGAGNIPAGNLCCGPWDQWNSSGTPVVPVSGDATQSFISSEPGRLTLSLLPAHNISGNTYATNYPFTIERQVGYDGVTKNCLNVFGFHRTPGIGAPRVAGMMYGSPNIFLPQATHKANGIYLFAPHGLQPLDSSGVESLLRGNEVPVGTIFPLTRFGRKPFRGLAVVSGLDVSSTGQAIPGVDVDGTGAKAYRSAMKMPTAGSSNPWLMYRFIHRA